MAPAGIKNDTLLPHGAPCLAEPNYGIENTLPEDLLREIFWFCLPVAHNATFSPREAPLLLTHICQHWKEIAFSMPSLWCSLHIPLGSTLQNLELATDAWLARAGALPLSISFGPPPRTFPPSLSYLTPYFQKLQQIPNALQTLSIPLCGEESTIQAFIEEVNKTGFNLMGKARKLWIHNDTLDPYIHVRDFGIFSALGLHENYDLHELKFSATFHILRLPKIPGPSVPWVNLRVLDLQTRNFYVGTPMTVRIGVLLAILNRCPKLVELKAFSAGRLMSSERQNVVLNPDLRRVSLLLLGQQSLDYVDLITKCDWPLLTSLHIGSRGQSGQNPGPGPTYILHQIVVRWGNRLTALRFTYPSDIQEHLIRFLSHLRNLVQLHIDYGIVRRVQVGVGSDGDSDSDEEGPTPDEVIHSLTPRSGAELPEHNCPHLQYFRWDGKTPFSDKAVIELVSNRALSLTSPVRLKQVVINFHRGPQDDIASACSRQIADGLKLKLAYNIPCINDAELSGPYEGLVVDEDCLEMGWV